MLWVIWDEYSGQWFLGQEDMEWHPSIGMFYEHKQDAESKFATLKAAYPHKQLMVMSYKCS
jgi:hypothetical protein